MQCLFQCFMSLQFHPFAALNKNSERTTKEKVKKETYCSNYQSVLIHTHTHTQRERNREKKVKVFFLLFRSVSPGQICENTFLMQTHHRQSINDNTEQRDLQINTNSSYYYNSPHLTSDSYTYALMNSLQAHHLFWLLVSVNRQERQ